MKLSHHSRPSGCHSHEKTDCEFPAQVDVVLLGELDRLVQRPPVHNGVLAIRENPTPTKEKAAFDVCVQQRMTPQRLDDSCLKSRTIDFTLKVLLDQKCHPITRAVIEQHVLFKLCKRSREQVRHLEPQNRTLRLLWSAGREQRAISTGQLKRFIPLKSDP